MNYCKIYEEINNSVSNLQCFFKIYYRKNISFLYQFGLNVSELFKNGRSPSLSYPLKQLSRNYKSLYLGSSLIHSFCFDIN